MRIALATAVLLAVVASPVLAAKNVAEPPWIPLCRDPDHPETRPPPWNHFPKLSALARCAACPNFPGNHVAACNPSGWDCAASTIFPPGSGGSCAFPPGGACDCPPLLRGAPGKTKLHKTEH
jgi:hypothetical protein